MKFKNPFDTEASKRRRIAKQALEEMRHLSGARYPLSLFFDRMNSQNVERMTGESWPEAFARALGGLTLEQLRDYASGAIETGLYRALGSEAEPPTKKVLRNY